MESTITPPEIESHIFTYPKHRWLRHTSHPITIQIYGYTGDHIFESIRRTCCFYEHALLKTLRRLLPTGPCRIVDVGANIGNHTVYFSKVADASVLAIEPGTKAATLLRKNIHANGIADSVHVIQAAAAAAPGAVSFIEASHSNLGMSRTVREPDGVDQPPQVTACTIDDAVAETWREGNTPVHLIKIDVEGAEIEALQGALQIVHRDRPIIVAELASPEHFHSFRDLTQEHGYRSVGPFCSTATYIFLASPLQWTYEWVRRQLSAKHARLKHLISTPTREEITVELD